MRIMRFVRSGRGRIRTDSFEGSFKVCMSEGVRSGMLSIYDWKEWLDVESIEFRTYCLNTPNTPLAALVCHSIANVMYPFPSLPTS